MSDTPISLITMLTTGLLVVYIISLGLMIYFWWRNKHIKLPYLLLAPSFGLILLAILTWLTDAPIGVVGWLILLAVAVAAGLYSTKWLKIVPMSKKHSREKKEEWTALLLLLITLPPLSETLTRTMINEFNSVNSVVLFSLLTLTLGVTFGLAFKVYRRKEA